MIKYSVKDMQKDLDEVRAFLMERGFRDGAIQVTKVRYKLERLNTSREEVLEDLSSISRYVHDVEEKEKIMNERTIISRRLFKERPDKMKKEKMKGNTIQKYDVVKIPTQGGFHCSVVYDTICDDWLLCYPITTTSARSLRMLGNRSHILQNSGCPEYDGYKLSSAAAYVSKQNASYCKVGHIKNHDEIDSAIWNFNCS